MEKGTVGTKKVWVLDDVPSVLKSTARLFESADWEVEAFDDPMKFLTAVESGMPQPSVAILDFHMLPIDGLEVLRRLRRISPEIRVMMLTSTDDPEIEAEALRAGAVAYFEKPPNDEALLAAAERALEVKATG